MTRLCLHVAPVAAALTTHGVHTDYLLCPDGLWTWDGNDWTLEEAMHPAVLSQARARGLDGSAHCLAAKTFHRTSGGKFIELPGDEPRVFGCDRGLGHDGNRHHDPETGVEWFG